MLLEIASYLDSDHTLFFGADPVVPHLMMEDGSSMLMEDGASLFELE